jgi:hypothetical protein
MGSVKGLWPALGPLMVWFNWFQQGTPLLIIIILLFATKMVSADGLKWGPISKRHSVMLLAIEGVQF